ncbi:MAG: helix-turn-helix transcriptional regulator [Planctomycetota bacterium]
MTEVVKFTELLGRRIRAIRKEMKLKRAEFARLVGMSMEAIGLIERGEVAPRIDTLHKIAVSLNIPLAKLLDLGKDIAPKFTSGALSSFNLYLKTKSPEQVKMIRNIAQNIFDHTTPSRKK